MAAKNKFKGRGRTSIARADADLQDLLGLHYQACRRAEEVEEQIQELHAAGKFAEARVLRMHAFGIQQGLRAIEAEVRTVVRPSKQPRPASQAAALLEPVSDRAAGLAGAPLLGTAGAPPMGTAGGPLIGSAGRRSLGADFEAAMDAGISFEIPR